MNAATLTFAMALATPGQTPTPTQPAPAVSGGQVLSPTLVSPVATHPVYQGVLPDAGCGPCASPVEAALAQRERRPFESDKAFEGFINPVSNPVFAKDPRSSTWARLLFVNNNFPGSHPFGGGNAQVYAMQLNVALTERLTLTADKDGYASISPRNGANTNGWLNLGAGLKYTLIRDVENQFLFTAGLMYEVPTGEEDAFQNHGGGHFTPFVSWGKQLGEHWHVVGNHGFNFGANQSQSSNFFYHQLHIDREIGGWFYPLVEFNWFQYTAGGDRLPNAVGEGDGLLNLGTRDMRGKQLFTTAVGAKVKCGEHMYLGGAYEFALSEYKGLLNNRVTVDLVLRY